MSTETKGRKCTGKRRYSTLERAVAALKRLIAQGAAPGALRAYLCEHCGCHHVGHRGRNSGRRRRT